MTRQTIFADLLTILSADGPDADVSAIALDDRPFREHGLDSMALIRLVADVEDRFDIEIDDADAMVAFSFQRLVDLIDQKVAA
jgi:acyl carrier protein